MAYNNIKTIELEPYSTISETGVTVTHDGSVSTQSPHTALVSDEAGHNTNDCWTFFPSTGVGSAEITIRFDGFDDDLRTPDGGIYEVVSVKPYFTFLATPNATAIRLTSTFTHGSSGLVVSEDANYTTDIDTTLFGGQLAGGTKLPVTMTSRHWHEDYGATGNKTGDTRPFEYAGDVNDLNMYWNLKLLGGTFTARTGLKVTRMWFEIKLKEKPKPTISSGEIVLNAGEMVIK